jgi:tRNA-dihydrouridine synthase A
MMDRTDRHFRRLIRSISPSTHLYSEMVVAGAVIHGDRERLLGFDPSEHPVALQLGGDDPAALAEAARIGADWGYDEINLNVGCPSDRVQRGAFGACLMLRPERVAECVAAMKAVVGVPVTVKHRIGVDDHDAYAHMLAFVDVVAEAGCDRFSVHARKAWLSGLSPKENREVPPLRYPDVHRLALERPDLPIDINGGIRSIDAVLDQLRHVDGVMIGRWAWDRPFAFAELEAKVFGAKQRPSRARIVEAHAAYAERQLAHGHRPVPVLRPLLNLYAGERGTKAWKRQLEQICRQPGCIGRQLQDAAIRIEAERAAWRASA